MHKSLWQRQLSVLRERLAPLEMAMGPRLGIEHETWFVADLAATRARGHLVIGFFRRRRKRSGEWGRLQSFSVDTETLRGLPDGEDRDLLELLRTVPYHPWYTSVPATVDRIHAGVLVPALHEQVLPRPPPPPRRSPGPPGPRPPP